jgi:hypothetical protein
VVESGPPRFAKQPQILGNLVLWGRYQGQAPGIIQLKAISRLDGPTLAEIADVPFGQGALLADEYLISGGNNGFPGGFPVVARKLSDVLAGRAEDLFVSNFGGAVAATGEYVFIVTHEFEPPPNTKKLFAKRIADIGKDDPALLRVITEYRFQTNLSRAWAASERWFVWQDLENTTDTWKLYARRIEDLFTPGSERLVVDTRTGGEGFRRWGVGPAHLDLRGSLLVFQAALDGGDPWGIYILDLEEPGPPVPVVLTDDPAVYLTWPAVSGDYVVWCEIVDYYQRTAHGRRLAGGMPAGEPFFIADGGNWITLERNIAVWNGATRFVDNSPVHGAIVAAELELPGADDVGDADLDGRIALADALVILNHLFLGGWRPRLRLADADLDRAIGLTDAVRILEYLFTGGRRPGTEG